MVEMRGSSNKLFLAGELWGTYFKEFFDFVRDIGIRGCGGLCDGRCTCFCIHIADGRDLSIDARFQSLETQGP